MSGSVTDLGPHGRPGMWKLRVALGKDPVTGKYRVASKTVRATSKRAARSQLDDFADEVLTDERAKTVTTARVLFERWLTDVCEQHLSPTTVYTYRGYVDRSILPVLGRKPVGEVTTADLDRLYRDLTRKGMAAGSVRQVHAIVRRAFEQGIDWDWVAVNPARRAKPPPVRRPPVSPPAPAVIVDMIAKLDANPQLASLLTTAAVIGARRGELCALRWSDVDLDVGALTISRALVDVGGAVTEKDTKTHAARTVSIPPMLVANLEAQRKRLEVRAGGSLGPAAFVWPNPLCLDGMSPWRPELVTGAFRALCKDLGVRARLHDLRHAMATQALASGVDVRTVSGRLGHANASTTLNIYSHWLPASDQKAANVLGDLYAPKKASQ